ncbi:hypothetical protein HYT84_01950 [Candidatus Micrarchaeota archaeon]|nr:hypothetical protein [Candidatus Micrarchaeota archaeon]
MSEIFAIRNVDRKTKAFIQNYAYEHDLKLGDALKEIVFLVQEYIMELSKNKQKKKYRSFFEIYDKIKFSSGDPNLSKNIDKILYGKRD